MLLETRAAFRPASTTDGETEPMRQTLAAAAILAALATPAFAMHCPADMAKIDAALAQNPQLSVEQLAEVKRLRAEGQTLHEAGQHQESVDTLAKAMEILGIQ